MDQNNRNVNKRFIQAMVEKNITTLRLAEKIGVCPSLISLIRQGWRQPTEQQVCKIEEVLGVPGLFSNNNLKLKREGED